MPHMDSIPFPPHVVGNLIAQSLDVSCKLENISLAQRELLYEADITVARYRDEMLLLAGFAHDFAISTLLREADTRAEVLRGYREAWENVGRHSEAGRILYENFLERCQVYAAATSNLVQSAVSPVALAFGEFLAADSSKAQLIALSFADGIFQSHFEGTQYALQKALLLPEDR